MTQITIKRQHDMSLEECKSLAEDVAKGLVTKYGGTHSIEGDNIYYRHMSGSKGVLRCSDSEVEVTVKVSFMMKPMARAIEGAIHKQFDKHFV